MVKLGRNYKNAANYERKIVKKAKAEGCIAFRSAGSHSPIDVCIIDTKERRIRLIQCKQKHGKETYNWLKKKIQEELKFIDGAYYVSTEVLP